MLGPEIVPASSGTRGGSRRKTRSTSGMPRSDSGAIVVRVSNGGMLGSFGPAASKVLFEAGMWCSGLIDRDAETSAGRSVMPIIETFSSALAGGLRGRSMRGTENWGKPSMDPVPTWLCGGGGGGGGGGSNAACRFVATEGRKGAPMSDVVTMAVPGAWRRTSPSARGPLIADSGPTSVRGAGDKGGDAIVPRVVGGRGGRLWYQNGQYTSLLS